MLDCTLQVTRETSDPLTGLVRELQRKHDRSDYGNEETDFRHEHFKGTELKGVSILYSFPQIFQTLTFQDLLKKI